MILTLTTSLEDLRNGVFYETREEFARRLGITTQTYAGWWSTTPR